MTVSFVAGRRGAAVGRGDRAVVVRAVVRERRRRRARRVGVVAALVVTVTSAFALTLMLGDTVHGPGTVLRVFTGADAGGASFVVGEVRLPRAVLGSLVGCCFGVAGVAFQTLLRNPLASPDVIGVNAGAGAAAVTGIVVLGWGGTQVAALALAGALGTAVVMHALGRRGRGVVGTRLILVGVGLDAVLRSVVSYVLSRASDWDLQSAMRWLTGSLNGATWDRVTPVAVVAAVVVPFLLAHRRAVEALRLGDDTAAALGVDVGRTRLRVMVGAVVLVAVATAAAGPVAFVAFMAGPVAARLTGPGAPLLVPAGLVGASLVLVADLVGQHAFTTRYPVGVVTGALGAPYLLVLLVRTNRTGGSL